MYTTVKSRLSRLLKATLLRAVCFLLSVGSVEKLTSFQSWDEFSTNFQSFNWCLGLLDTMRLISYIHCKNLRVGTPCTADSDSFLWSKMPGSLINTWWAAQPYRTYTYRLVYLLVFVIYVYWFVRALGFSHWDMSYLENWHTSTGKNFIIFNKHSFKWVSTTYPCYRCQCWRLFEAACDSFRTSAWWMTWSCWCLDTENL